MVVGHPLEPVLALLFVFCHLRHVDAKSVETVLQAVAEILSAFLKQLILALDLGKLLLQLGNLLHGLGQLALMDAGVVGSRGITG